MSNKASGCLHEALQDVVLFVIVGFLWAVDKVVKVTKHCIVSESVWQGLSIKNIKINENKNKWKFKKYNK